MNKVSDVSPVLTTGEPQIHDNLMIFPLYLKGKRVQTPRKTPQPNVDSTCIDSNIPKIVVHNTGTYPIVIQVSEDPDKSVSSKKLLSNILLPVIMNHDMQALARKAIDKVQKHQQQITSDIRNTSAKKDQQASIKVEAYLAGLHMPAADGILVAINGKIIGGKLFDHQGLMHQEWDQMIRGYAQDALEQQEQSFDSSTHSALTDLIKSTGLKTEEIYDDVDQNL